MLLGLSVRGVRIFTLFTFHCRSGIHSIVVVRGGSGRNNGNGVYSDDGRTRKALFSSESTYCDLASDVRVHRVRGSCTIPSNSGDITAGRIINFAINNRRIRCCDKKQLFIYELSGLTVSVVSGVGSGVRLGGSRQGMQEGFVGKQ